MKVKPVVPRHQANRDVDDAIDHYLGEGAEQAALNFIGELERAYDHIGLYPGSGSARYAHELNLPGLRTWPFTHFPHLIFYVEREDHIDVWRVLHGQRHIPASLQEHGTP